MKRKGPKPTPVSERIARKVVICAVSGCHTWQGATNGKGYGVILGEGERRMRYVHRLAYELAYGAIPDELVIDHKCRNRRCCNPDHLEPVTQAVNLERGDHPNFKAKASGSCRKGHTITADDIRRKDGRLVCRKCRNERRRANWRPVGVEVPRPPKIAV
jgi:hypothetical protein